MKVYASIFDHSYSSEYPGDRVEYQSMSAAKSWFSDFINDRIYRWNGYDFDFPCGGSEDAVMDLYGDQHADYPVKRLVVGPKRHGDYTVSEQNT